ncbi:MAG: hypothetical protein WAO38_01095 [Sulfuricurvum sp.]
MISRRYGVLDVLQRPGSALELVGNIRFASAHPDTLSIGSGLSPLKNALV